MDRAGRSDVKHIVIGTAAVRYLSFMAMEYRFKYRRDDATAHFLYYAPTLDDKLSLAISEINQDQQLFIDNEGHIICLYKRNQGICNSLAQVKINAVQKARSTIKY